jgi:hypothetical protein
MVNEIVMCKKCNTEYHEVWCLVMDQYVHYHNTACNCKRVEPDFDKLNLALENVNKFVRSLLVEKLLKK